MVGFNSIRFTLSGNSQSMMSYAADCGNAFLLDVTHERYYDLPGPDFGELEEIFSSMLNVQSANENLLVA